MLALTRSGCRASTPASQFQAAQGKCNACWREYYLGWTRGKPSRKIGLNKRAALRYCLFVGMSLAQQAFFGCNRDELRAHFEGRFDPDMTWDNYGRACDGKLWQVDHIVPCSNFDLSDPLQLRSITSCFSQPVPSQARWKSVDNSSQETTLALTRNHNVYQTRQFYGDLAGIEVPHNFRLTRQHITQNFDSGIPVNNVAASKVELAGMYMIDVGDGQTVKIGPTNRRPIITLVGDVTVGVQVGDTWTEAANGGVSAQDADGNALTVVTTGTVDTSILGISTLTYTAVSSQGDIAEVKQRFIVATDTTSPMLTLTGGNISLPVGDTWGGEPGYSATDNLDGDVTSQVQITGWSGDTSVAGQFTRTYTVTDSQGNVASTFRAISIADPSPRA